MHDRRDDSETLEIARVESAAKLSFRLALALLALCVPAAAVGAYAIVKESRGPSAPEMAPPRAPGRALVWLAPLPYGGPYHGSIDYMRLFDPEARWEKAARRTQVFKLYPYWAFRQASDAMLRTAVDALKRRGIALAVEVGPLRATNDCGRGVEGFGADGKEIARRIEAAGGTIAYLALDEPLYFGALYKGPRACRFSYREVARQVADYVRSVRSVFPYAVVGDIEPVRPGVEGEVAKWLDVYRQVAGEPLAFLHADVDWQHSGSERAVRAVERAARSRRIPFGIIYNGNGDPAGGDQAWVRRAEQRFVEHETSYGVRPQHVIFQSWTARPKRVLPEDRPGTMTYLVNRYFRPRPRLSLRLRSVGADEVEISGRLVRKRGAPVRRAVLALTAKPLDGAGVVGRYVASGIVPQGARRAVVGVRVNAECGCSGPSELAIQRVRFSEGGATSNFVPNGDLAAGTEGWGIPDDKLSPVRAEQGENGRWAIAVRTRGKDRILLNSTPFRVRGGRHYAVEFEARVAPVSVGSGYFLVAWLADKELGPRTSIPLAPASLQLATVRTNALGAVRQTVRIPQGSFAIEASYRGDARTFPARASVKYRELR